MSLADIFPRPRPLSLGGRAFLVGELTLGQLASLQADRDHARPDPLDVGGLRERLGGMEAEDRRIALVAAHAAAEAGSEPWRGPETDAELRAFVRVALERHNPGLTEGDVAGVWAEMTVGEYAALRRACFGVTALDEIEAYLGVDRSGGGESVPWAQAVCEVLETYPGLSLSDVEGLTVSQVRVLRSGGRPEIRGVPIRPGVNLKEMVRTARARFHGPGKGG